VVTVAGPVPVAVRSEVTRTLWVHAGDVPGLHLHPGLARASDHGPAVAVAGLARDAA
jgi:hypothetical protein